MPRPPALLALAALVAAALLLPPASAAEAQLVDPRISEARQSLTRYAPRGRSTYDTLRDLSEFLATAPEGPDAREARFLRAIAATDLCILAVRYREPEIEGRVAEAVGVPRDRLTAVIGEDLRGLEVGVYREAAERAGRALEALTALREGGTVRFEGLEGARRDALLVEAVHEVFSSRRPSVATLAAMSPGDPCADPDAACPEVYAAFDAPGRRAVRFLEEVSGALDRLEARAEAGDPFARQLAWSIPTDRLVFDGVEIAPKPRAAQAFPVFGGGQEGAPPSGAVLDVREDGVRFAFMPRARLTAGGVELVADGAPMLPGWHEVPLPRCYRPVVLPIEELVPEIRRFLGTSGVAVTTSTPVPAHLLSRVFLSLAQAGVEDYGLLGVDERGIARLLPVELVRGDAPENHGSRHVFVRLGGYSVQVRGRGLSAIPRVRGDDGFHFDVEALAAAVDEGPPHGDRSLSFMSVVPSDVVAEAAFGLSGGAPVTWIVP